MIEIKIKYFSDDLIPISFTEKGDWIDLRSNEDVELEKGEFHLVHLGVAMKLPEGYEAHIAPRSSTFRNFQIVQTNSVGIIDNSYCGDEDEWMMPVLAINRTIIHKNDRICQFRIIKKQPEVEFRVVDKLEDKSRGGFGSTGVN